MIKNLNLYEVIPCHRSLSLDASVASQTSPHAFSLATAILMRTSEERIISSRLCFQCISPLPQSTTSGSSHLACSLGFIINLSASQAHHRGKDPLSGAFPNSILFSPPKAPSIPALQSLHGHLYLLTCHASGGHGGSQAMPLLDFQSYPSWVLWAIWVPR